MHCGAVVQEIEVGIYQSENWWFDPWFLFGLGQDSELQSAHNASIAVQLYALFVRKH